MTIINNKKKLLNYLDGLISENKKYGMPKFSIVVKKSNFFKKNFKEMINLVKKSTQEINNRRLDELIFSSYFSSKIVIRKVKEMNYRLLMERKSLYKKKIYKKTKKIYLV